MTKEYYSNKDCFTLLVFVAFLAVLGGVTAYNNDTFYNWFLNKVAEPPALVDEPLVIPEPVPSIDITTLSHSDFKPLEYIPHTIERDNNISVVKCDLIGDIPEAFELKLYVSKSYDKLIKENLERTWLWQLGPDNEFNVVESAIRLAPSIDDIGLFMGYRYYHGKDPNGHYRLVIEFECDRDVNEDSSCIILAEYQK